MESMDEFWKKKYEHDPKGWAKHQETQKQQREALENEMRAERKKIADVMNYPTRTKMEEAFETWSIEALRNGYFHAQHVHKLMERMYYEKLHDEVFTVSHTTLKEIVSRHSWEEVKEAMVVHFPDQAPSIQGYEAVYAELQRLEPIHNQEHYVVAMREVNEEGGTFYEVIGLKENDFEHYALDFTPWEEWLGFTCDERSLQTHGTLLFIVHCLWEMTFDGFTQAHIQANLDELKERIDETKKKEEK